MTLLEYAMYKRYAWVAVICFGAVPAAVLVAGCGAAGGTAPSLISQSTAYGRHADSDDLLYVDDTHSRVAILTYPGYSYVSEFTVAKSGYPDATLAGMCADASGDVFIEAVYYGGSTILEYAHGGTTPIASLEVASYFYADDCASDGLTGDLAITGYGDKAAGNLAVFVNAQGSPQYYTDPDAEVLASCAYDKNGDLFVDGYSGSGAILIAELAKGNSTFTPISLDQHLTSTGALQWVGDHLIVEDTDFLYSVSISGSTGTIVSTTKLLGERGGGFGYIFRDSVIAPDIDKRKHARIAVWPYPRGGDALKHFSVGDVTRPVSEVISLGNVPDRF
jgi:hypothetical protein